MALLEWSLRVDYQTLRIGRHKAILDLKAIEELATATCLYSLFQFVQIINTTRVCKLGDTLKITTSDQRLAQLIGVLI